VACVVNFVGTLVNATSPPNFSGSLGQKLVLRKRDGRQIGSMSKQLHHLEKNDRGFMVAPLKLTTRTTRTDKSYFHGIFIHGRTPARGWVMPIKDCDDARSASVFDMLEQIRLVSNRGGRGQSRSSSGAAARGYLKDAAC
jgi:hypothetical protein